MRIFTWRQRVYTYLITLLSIGVFGGLGYMIDLILKISPVFFVLGLLVSFPVNAKILSKFMKKTL